MRTSGAPLSDPPVAVARPRPFSSVRASERTLAAATAAVLIAATALALWLRLTGLGGRDGTLSIDEARLALAARGVLEHGLPQLPAGWTYTRGLLPAYLTAASFALLGQGDLAARLPAVLAGTALVPAMYLLGRELAGRGGGLFAALFVAAYPPLVAWSRQAWLYAPYVLLYATALLFIVRAHRTGRARDQLPAGLLVGLSFFAHELGVFLLLPLGAQVAARLRRLGRAPGRRGAPLGALALAGAGAGLLWLLVTRLRADTLAGPYGEVVEYFSPHLDGTSFRFYWRMLVDSRGLVLAAALLGLPLAIVRRRSVALLLWLALLPPFVHAVTIIPDAPHERYGLTLVVALVALAVDGVAGWTALAVCRRPSLGLSSGVLAGLVFAAILAAHLDIGRAIRAGALAPGEGSWLRAARTLGIGPDDLVMTDLPTVVGWYLGHVDYWVRRREYEKYTLWAEDALRDVHTGALLVRDVGEYDRLVAGPNSGRTLWVLASGRRFQWEYLADDELTALLERSASLRLTPRDNSRLQFSDRSRILRIDLP